MRTASGATYGFSDSSGVCAAAFSLLRLRQTVFKDEDAITFDDPYRHKTRFRTVGTVGRVLLIVVHTENEPEPTTGERNGRIISARKTVTDERDLYEEKRRWAY